MTKDKQAKLCTIYTLVFALLTALVGALFILQTWSIYRSAPSGAYTRRNIAAHFKRIAPVVALWFAALVGNIALQIAFPDEPARPKAYQDVKGRLQTMRKNLPSDESSLAEIAQADRAGEKLSRIAAWSAFGVTLVAVVLTLTTLLKGFYLPLFKAEFFTAHGGAVNRLLLAVLLSLLALAAIYTAQKLIERSRKRRMAAYVETLKRAKAESRPKGERAAPVDTQCKCKAKLSAFWNRYQAKIVLGTKIAIGVVGIALVIVGVAGGGMKDVLLKAINICTQCIGLG